MCMCVCALTCPQPRAPFSHQLSIDKYHVVSHKIVFIHPSVPLGSSTFPLFIPCPCLRSRQDNGLENGGNILTELGLEWDPVDVRVVRLVCDNISSRSAGLCAAALATLANRIRVNRGLGHLTTTVGVDGTVYKKHPK